MQILDRLEKLHSFGFLHNDIKITNLCWGSYYCGDIINKDIIYLIDFGSVSTFQYPELEIKGNNKFVLEIKNFKK